MASCHKNADNNDRGNGGTYKFGDLVWARVGSHYWPGHIYHPSLASKSARDRRIPGDSRLLVSFFGDDSYCWCLPNHLLPFEPHFQRMSQQATTFPALLKKTIKEALDEVWRRASLGLTCRGLTEECRNCGGEICGKDDATGFFDVRVMDDEWSKIYSKYQIEDARKSFPLEKAIRLIRKLAESPRTVRSDTNYFDLIQMVGTTMAYRRRSFVSANERYRKEFKELTGIAHSWLLHALHISHSRILTLHMWCRSRMAVTHS